jgi:ribosomal protein L37E
MTTSGGPPPGGADTMPSTGLCDRCGMATYVNEDEGKLTCSGCDFPTDRCKCVDPTEGQTSPGV